MATVMRRLLTRHAIGYNRRHKRHGHHYKSILCQEEAYFLELVRYIHLNPLRAGLVKDLDALAEFAFSGHGVIMVKHRQSWQYSDQVLLRSDNRIRTARKRYKAFVAEGFGQARRRDLTGGGLSRSAGGWMAVKAMRKADVHIKSDERILGDGDSVAQILAQANEALEKNSLQRLTA